MITRLKVKNYRSIEEIDLPLSPLTVLVGKNGAGKSTILDVLAFVRDALNENLASAIKKRGGINSLLRWTPNKNPLDIEISLEFTEGSVSGQYSFSFSKFIRTGFSVKSEHCILYTPADASFRITEQDGNLILEDDGKTDIWDTERRPHKHLFLPIMGKLSRSKMAYAPVFSLLTNTEVYNIFAKDIKEPQEITDVGNLYGDGSNLGEILSHIQRDKEERIRFSQMLGYMIDGVEDIRVKKAGGYFITELKHHQKEGEAWFNLAHESEGTLKALAFLAAVYQEHTHSLIAIEEPDDALYAFTLGGVNDVLREGLLRRQIIITTQSPDLLIYFGVDELRIVEKIDGITKVGMIDDTQRRVIEKEIFHAGDLLRIEGLYRKPIADDEVAAVA